MTDREAMARLEADAAERNRWGEDTFLSVDRAEVVDGWLTAELSGWDRQWPDEMDHRLARWLNLVKVTRDRYGCGTCGYGASWLVGGRVRAAEGGP